MTGKQNETRTAGLNYPMVEVLTGAIMALVYLNTLGVWWLLPLTSPWAIHGGMDERTSE
jgi:hypothetical protein